MVAIPVILRFLPVTSSYTMSPRTFKLPPAILPFIILRFKQKTKDSIKKEFFQRKNSLYSETIINVFFPKTN